MQKELKKFQKDRAEREKELRSQLRKSQEKINRLKHSESRNIKTATDLRLNIPLTEASHPLSKITDAFYQKVK